MKVLVRKGSFGLWGVESGQYEENVGADIILAIVWKEAIQKPAKTKFGQRISFRFYQSTFNFFIYWPLYTL